MISLFRRWIPVSKRLPKNGETVLVCDAYGEITDGYHDDFRGGMWWIGLGGEMNWSDEDGRIVAWMPLPKPYKGVKHEED